MRHQSNPSPVLIYVVNSVPLNVSISGGKKTNSPWNAYVQKKERECLLVSQLSNRLTGNWCSNKSHQLETHRLIGNWLERGETRTISNEQNNLRASRSEKRVAPWKTLGGAIAQRMCRLHHKQKLSITTPTHFLHLQKYALPYTYGRMWLGFREGNCSYAW